MKSLAHPGREAVQRPRDALIWGLVIVLLVAAAVWGAWRLGVMAGDQVDWRQNLPPYPRALRGAPDPQPIPIPTHRRPAIATPAERR